VDNKRLRQYLLAPLDKAYDKMNIAEFIHTYGLHDTGIDRIIYNPNTEQLRLDVDLAQYELPSYDESMPELVEGTLVIDGVNEVQAEPMYCAFEDGVEMDGEILRLERNGKHHWEASIILHPRDVGQSGFLLLRFTTGPAEGFSFERLRPADDLFG
jgi:hypothetical protein